MPNSLSLVLVTLDGSSYIIFLCIFWREKEVCGSFLCKKTWHPKGVEVWLVMKFSILFNSDKDGGCHDPDCNIDNKNNDCDSHEEGKMSESEPLTDLPGFSHGLHCHLRKLQDKVERQWHFSQGCEAPFHRIAGHQEIHSVNNQSQFYSIDDFQCIAGWRLLVRWFCTMQIHRQVRSRLFLQTLSVVGMQYWVRWKYTLLSAFWWAKWKKKNSIQAYWSERSVISTHLFPSVKPRLRFWLVSRYLHLCDSILLNNDGKLRNLCPVLD